ncbi:HIT family protein [Candidatus Woesearchaeota archaeon]|nr:HIT family protein [Candidatus Woesearchaeota archaeon]
MEDCIFCKIIESKIPCSKIYENEQVLAFLDINPAAPGHTLVVPKKHSMNITDIDFNTLGQCIGAIKNLAPKIMKAVNATGFNIGMNNFKSSGQAVMHSHFHIIPRKENDGLMLPRQGKYKEGEIEEIKNKIIKELD